MSDKRDPAAAEEEKKQDEYEEPEDTIPPSGGGIPTASDNPAAEVKPVHAEGQEEPNG